MSQNYIKREEYVRDNLELRAELEDAKKAGRVRAILWSVLTALLTSVLIYEVTKAIK